MEIIGLRTKAEEKLGKTSNFDGVQKDVRGSSFFANFHLHKNGSYRSTPFGDA